MQHLSRFTDFLNEGIKLSKSITTALEFILADNRDFNYPDDKDYLFTTTAVPVEALKGLSKAQFEYKYR